MTWWRITPPDGELPAPYGVGFRPPRVILVINGRVAAFGGAVGKLDTGTVGANWKTVRQALEGIGFKCVVETEPEETL